MFYFIDSGLDINLPILIDFTIPIPLSDDLRFSYAFDFRFNVVSIFAILIGMFALFLISSINVVSSGISDEGTISLKQIVTFVFKFFVMNLPVTFLFSKSNSLITYAISITLFTFIVYFFNFMIDLGGESSV